MKKILTLALLGALTLGAVSCGGGDDDDKPGKVVRAEWYNDGRLIGLFNPLRYVYYIRWPAMPGADSYLLYKSDTASGEGRTLVGETTDLFFDGAFEILTTAGEHVRYYWVVAKTGTGETPRPANGGIKITYKVTLAQRIWIPGPPPAMGRWQTIGVDKIDREVTQNPIR